MKSPNAFDSIRHNIADKLLLVGLIVSIPSAIASGYRITTMGVEPLFILDIIIAFLLLAAYLTRGKTNYRSRMAFLLGYVFILGWISLYTWGLWGFGLFIIFFTLIITTTFFGMRYGLGLLGLSILIILLISLSVHNQWLNFQWDFNTLSHSTFHWLSRVVFFSAFTSMAVVTLGLVHKNFERINKDLSASEQRYNLALDSVNEAVWELDLINRSTFVSKKFFDILQFAPDEFAVSFSHWKKFIHKEDKAYVEESIREHMEGRSSSITIEYRAQNKFGGWQWILTKGKIVSRDEKGNPIRVLGTHTDISPRKEMEKILRQSEQRYRMLFMSANDTILLVENGMIIDANESAFDLLGIRRENLIGMDIWSLCPKIQSDGTLSKKGLSEFLKDSTNENASRTEWEFVRTDGQIVDTVMSINRITDTDWPFYQLILHDISDRRRFEQDKLNAIVEAEERERLKLAGDLHDDVGPLLSSLNMYLSLLGRPQIENREEIIKSMEGILKETIGSVREISNNLSPHILTKYGLLSAVNAFVESNKNLLKIELKENIGDIPLPKIVETSCYRIIKELLNNTLKYAQAKNVEITLTIQEKMLYLGYRDDGIGFDLESKLSKGKTGIGLLNILDRVKSLKATYSIHSKAGEGFCLDMKFRI
jgi:PAS domain S-box-containing protein